MAPRPPTSLYIQTPDPAAIRGASPPVFPVPWLRGCPVSFQWEAGFFKFNFGKGTGSSNPRDSRHTSLRSHTVGDAYFGCDVILHYDGEEIASDNAKVVVLTADGQRVAADFDLAKLP